MLKKYLVIIRQFKLLIMLHYFLHKILVITLINTLIWQFHEEGKTLTNAKLNGYMFAKSSCKDDYTSSWSSRDIANELRGWFNSISVIKNKDKSDNFGDRNLLKLSKNVVSNTVMVTSIVRLTKHKNEKHFEGWTKAFYTSNDQFHDGFYYGLMNGINGTITGIKQTFELSLEISCKILIIAKVFE